MTKLRENFRGLHNKTTTVCTAAVLSMSCLPNVVLPNGEEASCSGDAEADIGCTQSPTDTDLGYNDVSSPSDVGQDTNATDTQRDSENKDTTPQCVNSEVLKVFIKDSDNYYSSQDLSQLETGGASKVARPGAARCDYGIILEVNSSVDAILDLTPNKSRKAGYDCTGNGFTGELAAEDTFQLQVAGEDVEVVSRTLKDFVTFTTKDGSSAVRAAWMAEKTFAGENENIKVFGAVLGYGTETETVNIQAVMADGRHYLFDVTSKGWQEQANLVCNGAEVTLPFVNIE